MRTGCVKIPEAVKVFNPMRREELNEFLETLRAAHTVRTQVEAELRPGVTTSRAGLLFLFCIILHSIN